MKMMIITRIGRRTAITRNNRGELNERGPAVLQKHVLFSLSSFLVFIVVVVVVVVMSLFFFHFCFFCMCFFDDDDGFWKQRTKKKRDFS